MTDVTVTALHRHHAHASDVARMAADHASSAHDRYRADAPGLSAEARKVLDLAMIGVTVRDAIAEVACEGDQFALKALAGLGDARAEALRAVASAFAGHDPTDLLDGALDERRRVDEAMHEASERHSLDAMNRADEAAFRLTLALQRTIASVPARDLSEVLLKWELADAESEEVEPDMDQLRSIGRDLRRLAAEAKAG